MNVLKFRKFGIDDFFGVFLGLFLDTFKGQRLGEIFETGSGYVAVLSKQ